MDGERRVHPDCINASNPYHECVEYCFKKIAEAKAKLEKLVSVDAIICFDASPVIVYGL
ncbi:hypothetical protein F2Q68_00033846 [Brassica cretica]|uniref:Uncharacterized protein n=1 Tax=Brassica cretica TaxID=69181 RepID=A0A8S9H213_BRACR|nr:hypothetical protein F2Q68_00033846 [Brassica cretica]